MKLEAERLSIYSMDDTSLHIIAKKSSRPGPISISDVIEVGFKEEKRWWQFWKK